ncbi:MAG: hypothetical protein QNJ53_25670 [Pleurocapsa sp. MO_192.B19]|nr:hypothetical protein [Pleurocapsa sp. MO_192.B19]
MKKITIRISDEEHSKLKVYSQLKEQSLNNVIRELIRSLKVAQNKQL